MSDAVLLQSEVAGHPCRRGKVRDVYDLGDTLAVVATDRISAFDWVLPTGIPGKGRVLTALTVFWLNRLGVPHHLLSTDLADLPPAFRQPELAGRTMHVCKANVVPFECVARGYLAGSGWKEYRQSGTVCGISLPSGLRESDKLPEPIFTPATKAEQGAHDENVPFDRMAADIGVKLADELRAKTLAVYQAASDYAAGRGVLIADTKLEWGVLPSGEVILIDEVLTPDSSRFWPADRYQPGSAPPSFDKQFVRDWLEASGWDKASPPPSLPADVAGRTAAKYREALDRLTAPVGPTP
ncbi:MAG: phosphoribosylaminoimidazolesuccinocarboxamide synthase [Gemmataceae bacterium]